jgi:hypothetical protein
MIRAIALTLITVGSLGVSNCSAVPVPDAQRGTDPGPVVDQGKSGDNKKNPIVLRVSFDNPNKTKDPVDVSFIFDGSGMSVNPNGSPWAFIVYPKVGVSLRVTNRTRDGYSRCRIQQGTKILDDKTLTGYGTITCVAHFLGRQAA